MELESYPEGEAILDPTCIFEEMDRGDGMPVETKRHITARRSDLRAHATACVSSRKFAAFTSQMPLEHGTMI
jgi:hypothetical protein